MPRLPRIAPPGYPQHIIQRGNNRQSVFFATGDYARYLDALHEASQRYECAVHAYVLMTNHVHLLATPFTSNGLSRLMQSIGRGYVRYVNQTYKRTGTLWEGRFKSAVIQSDAYLLACMRYIELNPVRAGMVSTPGAYEWSSFGPNARGVASEIVTPHSVYDALGRSGAQRQSCYRQLFANTIDAGLLGQIRTATNNGEVIGSQGFSDQLERALARRVRKLRHGGDRRSDSYHRAGSSSTLTP